MYPSDSTDDFLVHVFPGSSAPVAAFRGEIDRLNRYCQRYKGAVNCLLFTGEPGVGKTFTAYAISAHSQWLTLTEDEKRELYYDRKGRIAFPGAQLVDQLLTKEHLPEPRGKPKRVPRLATVLGPQLADDLAASELFGHMKHAFTGAEESHRGIFGDDAVDDILLDEIADLTPRVQAKLLQFIETRRFRPVGGLAEDERTSEHRLFLATNRNLAEWVRQGSFREDLYWRIQGHRIEIPPLRLRKESIRDLAQSILNSVNRRQRGEQQLRPASDTEVEEETYCLLPQDQLEGHRRIKSNWVVTLTEDDLQWCHEHDWPGNVRELKQRIELYVYYNGHRRLSDVMHVQSIGSLRRVSEVSQVSDDDAIQECVSRFLQRVLQGEETPPPQPNDLLRRFEQIIKHAVYRFKIEKRLGPDDLKSIFPDAKDPDSTVARWKS